MNELLNRMWWAIYVRRKVKRAYYYGHVIEAAATIAACGYGETMAQTVDMARFLARKHGWRYEHEGGQDD